EGGYATSLTSCQNGTAFSFANKTCYKDISDKTCEDRGYSSSCPTNQEGTPVSYCGKNCYSGCKQPSCEDGGYLSNTPANNVCKDITYYGRTCKTDCKQPSCSDGGYKNGIPTNNVCTQVDYYGTKCFKDCYQPTCDNGGYKDAVPANQTCTPVTYYGRNCQKDCEPNEIQIACKIGSILYEDQKCYSKTNKTPIAVVFDTDKKLAMGFLANKKSTGWVDYVVNLNNIVKYDYDILSLENCKEDNLLSCDTDGKFNTAKIIQAGKVTKQSFPAAEYCYNYTTAGTKAGDWHLPSFAEAKKIYDVQDTLNSSLRSLSISFYFNITLWTSNEMNGTNAIYILMNYGLSSDYCSEKTYNYHAIPVLHYHDEEDFCSVGSVLYEDKKCYGIGTTNKTPIGIVFDTDNRLAVALSAAPNNLKFSEDATINVPGTEDCTNLLKYYTTCGIDGKVNTAEIIAYGKSNNVSFPAAEYCNNYKTAGTKAGDWFLPSAAQAYQFSKAHNQIKAALQSLGKSDYFSNFFWTSTENTTENWLFNIAYANSPTYSGTDLKTKSYKVIPVLAY
ncbi:MAG: hypothetical protein J6A33_06915, partial [Alphaproteobacteria bacterium]|nr:hypothetical protein [Alphaproteobacteria bacterium]